MLGQVSSLDTTCHATDTEYDSFNIANYDRSFRFVYYFQGSIGIITLLHDVDSHLYDS